MTIIQEAQRYIDYIANDLINVYGRTILFKMDFYPEEEGTPFCDSHDNDVDIVELCLIHKYYTWHQVFINDLHGVRRRLYKDVTQKQDKVICDIEFNLFDDVLKFTGTTKLEARDFIGKYIEQSKKSQKITYKQKSVIAMIEENLQCKPFEGETREEARDYISKYIEQSHYEYVFNRLRMKYNDLDSTYYPSKEEIDRAMSY